MTECRDDQDLRSWITEPGQGCGPVFPIKSGALQIIPLEGAVASGISPTHQPGCGVLAEASSLETGMAKPLRALPHAVRDLVLAVTDNRQSPVGYIRLTDRGHSCALLDVCGSIRPETALHLC